MYLIYHMTDERSVCMKSAPTLFCRKHHWLPPNPYTFHSQSFSSFRLQLSAFNLFYHVLLICYINMSNLTILHDFLSPYAEK